MRLKWISHSIILFLISNILTAQSSNLNEKKNKNDAKAAPKPK